MAPRPVELSESKEFGGGASGFQGQTSAAKSGVRRGAASIKQRVCFWFAYCMFGSVGFVTSVGCFLLSLLPGSVWMRRFGQRTIHCLFAFFIWYCRRCGLMDLRAEGLNTLRGRCNLILAANHPSLLDAVIVSAHLENIFCLMKASLVHNVALCGQSKLAGYVNNKSGAGLIKACESRMQEGSMLLVFPEGTRTREELGRFKMGFALLSATCGAPIQTLVIRYSQPFLGKGWPFFQAPRFPIVCTVELGEVFKPHEERDGRELGLRVEDYFRRMLARPGTEEGLTWRGMPGD